MAEWEAALLAAGVSAKSLPRIQQQLQAGTYDEGYIGYVLRSVRADVQAGKVKKQGGAVFTALTEGYLLEAYQQAQQQAPSQASRPRKPTPTSSQQAKLQGQLEDAHKSLAFVQTADCYTEQTRPAALVKVQTDIAQLEAALQQLAS